MAVNASKLKQMTAQLEADNAAADAYQAALVAPAKTEAQVANINAGVQAVTESTGNVYDATKAMTVASQPTINPAVAATQVTKPTTSGPDYTNAFAILAEQLRQWGLGTLADSFVGLAKSGMTPQEAMNKVKYDKTVNPATGKPWNTEYAVRFAGNQARLDKGLNALSEGTYIQNENSYTETLKAYGLNNMLSTDRTTNEAKFATYIANDLSPTEFKDRIDLAATRVINMDPAIQKNFMEYYPEVSKSDLISYFLAPDETMPLLKTKVTASEIGTAAGMQGLKVGVDRATEFAKMGETYGQAQLDYGKVADVLPTGQKLSSIYGEEGIAYNQATAEDEFIKNDAEAKLKRNRLASKERAMFGGDSGLSSQFSSLGKSIQGKY